MAASYLGDKSLPCCIRDPIVNHIEFTREKSFTNTSDSVRQGWGLSHSYGLNLKKSKKSRNGILLPKLF